MLFLFLVIWMSLCICFWISLCGGLSQRWQKCAAACSRAVRAVEWKGEHVLNFFHQEACTLRLLAFWMCDDC